ncbi:MAG TPA: hypothetical protein VJT74_08440 [Pyrinomonadaceae bacterium]|nr:hypothetical protein [Pyrinomonadaceae bacterium]
MKSCPTCRRIYADDTLRFCLEDGAPLSADVRPGTERTQALPTEEARAPAPTKVLDDPALAPTLPARDFSAATLRRREPPRAERRSTTSVVALTVVATVLLLGLGGVIAWQMMKDDKKVEGNGNANPTPSQTATPTPQPSPAAGFIEGSMAYPSDGIPGVMVACAENAETRVTVCSEKRKDWEEGVRYSLRVPPGRYYVYATLLPGDDSVGELTGKRAYYTDYMKCGMGANCSSHLRIVLELAPGVTLSGVTVGDWWADL